MPKMTKKKRLLVADKRIENQQKQVIGLIRTNFLKRFESSTCAFESSCARLFLKLFNWVEDYIESDAETKRLERFKRDHEAVLIYLAQILPDAPDLLLSKADRPKTEKQKRAEQKEKYQEEDATPELEDESGLLSRDKYKIDSILEDCFNDLSQIAQF